MNYCEDDPTEIIQVDAQQTLTCSLENESQRISCAEYLKQYDISQLIQMLAHSTEEFVRHVWLRGWQVVNHRSLPAWLRDNDFILHYHRPQLNTFWACFKSIFRVHTETGNIWTHLLGKLCLFHNDD
ncbi:Adiponectin receptor protein [Schistosoma japonicum]|nr:Adiponectin receptor protein [Schistosoma japonicum]KAH8861392.1 Adiponectin receptor protein [Schistosoma japonicum]